MTLIKEEARQWIPILQAFVEGRQLQIRTNVEEWIDIDTSQVLPMTFSNHSDFTPDMYRIKEN